MSEIQKSVDLLKETLTKKGQDYRGDRGEFFNFEKAAEFSGMEILDVINAQIGIKVTRIESALNTVSGMMNYESLGDSYLDLAGYAIIAHAYMENPAG